MSAEIVVFDDIQHKESIEIAIEETKRAGLVPEYFRDGAKAVEAVGFFTRGVITSPGQFSFLSQRYKGITLLDAAKLLEIPRAVFDDAETLQIAEGYIRQEGSDLLVPRVPQEQTIVRLRAWVTNLAAA